MLSSPRARPPQGDGPLLRTCLKLLPLAFGGLLVAFALLRFAALPYIDRKHNAVLQRGDTTAPATAEKLHSSDFVADLHADSLLWGRNLSASHSRGHVDLPRLREAGVSLQVFGVVTKVPQEMSYRANRADSDRLPLLFVASWRPIASWFSPFERALAQAGELRRLARPGELTLVLRERDLAANGLKALLALEGLHALEGEAGSLERLFDAGFRMMGLSHLFDNAFSGSAHGTTKHGLTARGRTLLARMEDLGVTVDLAHASRAAFAETLALATRPVVVSHTGVQGTCPGVRNLSDEQLRRLAANGGVVGIGFWKGAVCDASLHGIVAAIRHAVDTAGVDHVGLGSDFDGYVATPFDVRGVPKLIAALKRSGLSESDVRKIVGGNVRRLLAHNLPR